MPPLRPRNTTRKRNRLIETPPFHYTKSKTRRIWVCEIYPHAKIFLGLCGAIQWDTWSYHDSEVSSAKFADQPYYALGGTVEEVYNEMFMRYIPKGEELHGRTDPTGDLDVRICPLQVHGKYYSDPRSYYLEKTYKNSKDIKLQPFFEAATDWLVDQFVSYFKPFESKLKRAFPTALPFIKDYDIQSQNAKRIERVGPLTIIRTTYLQDSTPLTKIQVKLTIPKPDIIARAATEGRNFYKYTKDIIQDHMIEFGFWQPPNEFCDGDTFLYKPYNLLVRDFKGESYGCLGGLQQRLNLIEYPSHVHKCLNYVYRLRFILKVMDSLSKTNTNNKPSEFNISRYNFEEVAENVKGILRLIENKIDTLYTKLSSRYTPEKQKEALRYHLPGYWFVYYEIVRVLPKSINQFIDQPRIANRIDLCAQEIIASDILTKEQKEEIYSFYKIDTLPQAERRWVYRYRLFEEYLAGFIRPRYIFGTPVGCNEAIPHEAAELQSEINRRAAEPLPERGPSIHELPDLPSELTEERRGKPLYKRNI